MPAEPINYLAEIRHECCAIATISKIRQFAMMASTRGALHILSAVIVVVLFAAASVMLFHEFRGHRFDEIFHHAGEISAAQILVALILTALSYSALVGYDFVALAHLGKRLPLRRVAHTAFISFAFSHNLGGALLTGGSLRYRLYSAAGLSASETLSITLLAGLAFAAGIICITGIVLLIEPEATFSAIGISRSVRYAVGGLCLVVVMGWLVFVAVRRRTVRLLQFAVPVPSLSTALLQIALAIADIGFAAAIVFVLLPEPHTVSYSVLLGAFVLATVAGFVSHVPGGLGVFETVLVLLLPSIAPPAVLGAALAYRLVYYLLPLVLAAGLLAWHELRRHFAVLSGHVQLLEENLSILVPPIIGGLTFIAGAVLLFSGALPSLGERMDSLGNWLSLPVIEISHLVASVSGLGLLILSRGLFRKLDGAWLVATILTAVSILASLLKGLDVEEAALLTVLLAVLLATRDAFRRKSALIDQRYNARWFAALTIVLATSVWLGLASFRHVDYANELWWQFSLDADLPRYLRASVVVTVLAAAIAINYLIKPAPFAPGEPSSQDIDKALGIARSGPSSVANAALTGDKHLMFSDSGDAMLMYGISGQSWIALGDPAGNDALREDLAWRFREMSDRYGARTVFYQVGTSALPIYLDMGLVLTKLGEEAVVPLSDFSLSGGKRRTLRQAHHRAVRDGLTFEVVPGADTPQILEDLHRISESWLAEKHVGEKGFSVGRFSADYLRRFPCAVARANGDIVAFANLWPAAPGTEISIDLMRRAPGAPNNVMDFMFCEIMLWGRQQGFGSFNMGMAPLSGLEDRTLAPLWHRLGDFVFQHGEYLYNFEGLRAFKEKYSPEWRPKYLASPGGLQLPRVIFDVTRLIAGGTVAILR